MIDLSIIVLSYNTRELLRACLSSIVRAQTKRDRWEIVVVDNASTDGSVEMVETQFPGARCIRMRQNAGYAKGNNAGIRQAKGKNILLLNSDTEIASDAIQKACAYLLHHKDVGVVTVKLLLPDGTMDPACHRGFPTPWSALTYFLGLERLFPSWRLFGQYHQGYKNKETIHEIDSPSGAFFLVRGQVIQQIGMLDEDFFMYGEDLDWAYRIRKRGWKIIFYPESTVLHKKWKSGKVSPDPVLRDQIAFHFYDSMRLFYRKHYRHRYGWFITGCVLVGIKLRSLL